MSLICYDCHIRRRVIAPVLNEVKAIVGWRCKKCIQKLYAGGSLIKTEGNGWRRRFDSLLQQAKDQATKKMAPQVFKAEAPVRKEVVKKTLVNKIASFFRRRSM